MINFRNEDETQNETVRQTLERVARELGVFGTTPTNNITHSPRQTQQPTAWSSSPNYSATAANNWQIKPTTSVPQNSNTFGSTQQPSQPAGFTPSPTQPMSQTPAAVANQTGQSSGSTSLFDNPDAIKQQNGQPSPVMQAIYRYLANTYGQQNPQTLPAQAQTPPAVQQPANNMKPQIRMPTGSEQQITLLRPQRPTTWSKFKDWAGNTGDAMQASAVGYASGTTLGNFDEGVGIATAVATLNPNNYTMARNAIRELQKDLQQRHPIIYGGAEFAGAMFTPMHLAKGENFKQKAFNALTDTLNASAGYAENWNDFGTNLAVNSAANMVGLAFDAIPIFRTLGSNTGKTLLKGGKKFIKQGINSVADKMKNMYYKENEDEERYY